MEHYIRKLTAHHVVPFTWMQDVRPRLPRMILRDLTLEIFEIPRRSEARVISLDGSFDQIWAFYTWMIAALPDDLYEDVNDLGGIDPETDIRDQITGAPIHVALVHPDEHCDFVPKIRHIIDTAKETLNNQDRSKLICIFTGKGRLARLFAEICVHMGHPMMVFTGLERRRYLLEW